VTTGATTTTTLGMSAGVVSAAAAATGDAEIVYSCHYRKSSKLFAVIDMY
jgi:hypothetical protein